MNEMPGPTAVRIVLKMSGLNVSSVVAPPPISKNPMTCAADVRLDQRQIVFFIVVGADAAMDARRRETLGRADAARYFLVRHRFTP